MAVAEANMPKRKINELGDITNKKNYHKKLKKSYQVQQRAPSPSSCSSSCSSSSPSRHKCDEVSANTRAHSHSKSVSFQPTPQYHSPLLTPKEEDDDEYMLDVQYAIHDDEIPVGAPTPEEPEELQETDTADLDHNPDYIALTSSLRLLSNNKEKIENEIVELSGLLNYYKNVDDKEQIIEFFIKLLNNNLRLPKQNKILKCPIINWSNYNLTNDCKFNANHDKPLFKTLNLFNSNS